MYGFLGLVNELQQTREPTWLLVKWILERQEVLGELVAKTTALLDMLRVLHSALAYSARSDSDSAQHLSSLRCLRPHARQERLLLFELRLQISTHVV